MANYPLKNISIGGDTYEIQAGTDLFDFYVRVDCDYREITTSNIVSIGVSKNWQQIPTADIWSTMSGDAANSAQVQLSIAPNEYAPSGAEGCNLWVLNRYPYSSGSVSSQDFIFISEPYDKNGTPYITKVVITVNEYNQLSGVGESIALGGGGGGSPVLAAMNNSSLPGNLTDFAHISANASFYIWAKVDNATLMSLNDIKTMLADGPVMMKDQTGYVTIGLRDASTIWFMRPVDDFSPIKMIYCTYSSGTQKWTVSTVKNITTS